MVDAHLQEAGDAVSWTAQIASSLSKRAPKLQSELLGKTFMSFFIEWCQETREASCAFMADKTTWLFDDSLHKIFSVQSNHIPWSLTDILVFCLNITS